MLLTKEELVKLLNNAGLTALEHDGYRDASCVDLATNDISVLIDYAKTYQVKHIFYRYHYECKDDYDLGNYISNECSLQEDEYIFENMLNLAKKDIAQYKRTINSIDFEKPVVLSLMCLHNGATIAMKMEELWLGKLVTPEDFWDVIKLKYKEELNKLQEELKEVRWKEKQAQKERVIQELKDMILANSEFTYCTSQMKRYAFIKKVLNNPDNSMFYDAFVNEYGNLDIRETKCFIDSLYAEYKRTNIK